MTLTNQPMNYDFLSSIPWRLASLAGLIIGCVAVASGVTDYTVVLLRMGIAFIVFYGIGLAASVALRSVAGVYSVKRPGQKRSTPKVQPVNETEDMPAEEFDQAA